MSLYKTLGVAVTATRKEIKTAYLKLATKLHPDKKDGDGEQFKKIKHAYDVLSNADKRSHYDQTGEDSTRKIDMSAGVRDIFKRIIDSGEFYGNIIDLIIQRLKKEISTAESQLIKFDESITKLEKQKGRITTEGENFFDLMLDGKIANLNRAKENMNLAINRGEQLMVIFNDYSDENPLEREPVFSSFDVGQNYNTGFFNP